MVAFEKKPMGEDKIQGYAFSITFVCQRDGAEHDSPSPDDLNNQNSMAGRDLD